jgi:hypothetical protein
MPSCLFVLEKLESVKKTRKSHSPNPNARSIMFAKNSPSQSISTGHAKSKVPRKNLRQKKTEVKAMHERQANLTTCASIQSSVSTSQVDLFRCGLPPILSTNNELVFRSFPVKLAGPIVVASTAGPASGSEIHDDDSYLSHVRHGKPDMKSSLHVGKAIGSDGEDFSPRGWGSIVQEVAISVHVDGSYSKNSRIGPHILNSLRMTSCVINKRFTIYSFYICM